MLAHVPIAIGVQIICGLIGRSFGSSTQASLWIGAFAGSAVCVMREITQREYQWIEAFGHGHRANMPAYAGLQIWEWNQHSLEETAAAIIVVVTVALAVQLWR
jgi:hypothetical protein